MPPTLYIKNALKLSDDGIGDGTAYTSSASAVPDQANRTFTLSGGTGLIADIGANVDDKFNGHILYFPNSGNKYHIVDWVASTAKATTWETPQLTDLGACEIRRALVDNKALAGNPTHRLADGKRHSKWKTGTSAGELEICLENAVRNGGFEEASLAPWSDIKAGGVVSDYQDLSEVSQPELNTGDGYQTMKSITVTDATGGTFYVYFEGYITAGNDWWAWSIEKNSVSVASGPFTQNLHPESSGTVHTYQKFRIKITGLVNNDIITLKMKASDSDGLGVGTADGQVLFAQNFIIASDASELNTASPLLGAADYFLALGGRTQRGITQTLGTLKAGKTYRILFKAKATAGFIQDKFDITLAGNPGTALVMSANSGGNINPNNRLFYPALTTNAAWHWVDVVTPVWDVIGAAIQINLMDPAFDVNIDEIYFFEKVSAAALLIFDHGGFTNNSVTGRFVSSARTGRTAGVDDATLLSAAIIPDQPVAKEFTAGIYPIYSIGIQVNDTASEILLCEKWAWLHGPNRGNLDFNAVKYEESEFKTRSGIRQVIRHSQATSFRDTYPSVPDADKARLLNDFKPNHKDVHHPFALVKQTGDVPILVTDEGDFGLPYKSINPDWTFNFKEVL